MGTGLEILTAASANARCSGDESARGGVAWILRVVAVPAAIVAVDHFVFASGMRNFDSLSDYGILLPLLVGQVALLSYASVRLVPQPALQWLVYVWSLVLLDLVVFSAMMVSARSWWEIGFSDIAFALFAGQLSAVLVWLVLGDASWPWRIAVSLVLLAVYAVLVEGVASARNHWGEHVWPMILLAQSAVVLVLSLALRWILRVRMADPREQAAVREPLRFSLHHLLAWTTAVCLVLVILKGADGTVLQRLEAQEVFPATLIAVCLGLGCLVAVWAALGSGWWGWRLVLLALTAVASGLAVMLAGPGTPGPPWNSRLEAVIDRSGAGWIVWHGVAMSLLAALLLFFRFRGLRLVTAPRLRER